MPKDRRLNFLSSDRARASPYACSSKDSNQERLESSLPPVGDEKEWEEARCPICMEHPHNAVLLLCSSRDKGCHPYMCDTSHRHSNCLDQFCKSIAGASSTVLQRDASIARMQYPWGRVEQTLLRPTRSPGGQIPELLCPLCRGQIRGWIIIENARCYMNSKIRSCALESCNFSGNYIELRKHARHEHPTVKPSDIDPERQSEWARLERERDLGDTLSAVQSQFGYDFYGYYSPSDVPLDIDSSDGPDSSISDDTVDEWSEDSDRMSVDFDIGVEFSFSFLNEFSFGPSEEARNTDSTRTGAGSHNRRSMRSRDRANYQGGITSYTRRNTTPSSLGSDGVRNSGTERTGGRSPSRRSMRSRSRSNHQVEISFPRRRNTTPLSLGAEGARNTGSGRNDDRSLNRRSRSRSNRHIEFSFPRRRNTIPSSSGSEGARNSGSERTGGRSLRRSMRSRSRSNHRVEILSPRRRNSTPPSRLHSWRQAG